MVNEKLLRQKIKKSGLKYKFIAEQLGLSYQGFSLKLCNINEFTVKEAYTLSELLGIRDKSLNSEIFLPGSDT